MRKLLLILLLVIAPASADLVDLMPPETIEAEVGEVVTIPYYATPQVEENQEYVGIQVYITWDSEKLRLLDAVEGDVEWWDLFWPMGGCGGAINDTWEDGDAILMAFDLPGDGVTPSAPNLPFMLEFEVLESGGCVRIDEGWCPDWDPDCPPLRTRISDPGGYSIEGELGTSCVIVENDEPEGSGDAEVKQDDVKEIE